MERDLQDPQELLSAHRYADAIAACDLLLKQRQERSVRILSRRAYALLCLGSLESALADFLEANSLEGGKRNGRDQPYLQAISAVQWMMRRKGAAIATLRRAVDGIVKHKISHADTPGAVGEGLLLWYFGTATQDESTVDYALRYLDRRPVRLFAESWAGQVASFVLDRLSLSNVLFALAGTDDLRACIALAKADLLTRRRICLALFYAAVRSRAAGDEPRCLDLMRRCFDLENPILEEEWYLSRAEVGEADEHLNSFA